MTLERELGVGSNSITTPLTKCGYLLLALSLVILTLPPVLTVSPESSVVHAHGGEIGNAVLLFSYSVESNSLRPHGLQHTRLPCPPLYPRVCSNSCPLSRWCHPAISSSATPFSSCPQSFLASGSFPVSQLFTSGGQNTGASTSASILPMNSQGWFPSGLTGLILAIQGTI